MNAEDTKQKEVKRKFVLPETNVDAESTPLASKFLTFVGDSDTLSERVGSMATFKKLAGCVSAFNRDEQGASGSIEQVGGVAVAVLILAAVYKIMGDGTNQGVVKSVKDMLTNLLAGKDVVSAK